MKFETKPVDWQDFKFVLKSFPYAPHDKVFYATFKPKSIINKVVVSWYDYNIEKQSVEYSLSEVQEFIKDGTWRVI